jgi:hypothetical protein
VGAGAGIKLGSKASPSRVTELRRRPCRELQVYSCWGFPARSRLPDGADAAGPLNGCRGGVADYSSSVNFAGISRSGRLGLIFVEEGGQAEHVQREALLVSSGDQHSLEMIHVVIFPVGHVQWWVGLWLFRSIPG